MTFPVTEHVKRAVRNFVVYNRSRACSLFFGRISGFSDHNRDVERSGLVKAARRPYRLCDRLVGVVPVYLKKFDRKADPLPPGHVINLTYPTRSVSRPEINRGRLHSQRARDSFLNTPRNPPDSSFSASIGLRTIRYQRRYRDRERIITRTYTSHEIKLEYIYIFFALFISMFFTL